METILGTNLSNTSANIYILSLFVFPLLCFAILAVNEPSYSAVNQYRDVIKIRYITSSQ